MSKKKNTGLMIQYININGWNNLNIRKSDPAIDVEMKSASNLYPDLTAVRANAHNFQGKVSSYEMSAVNNGHVPKSFSCNNLANRAHTQTTINQPMNPVAQSMQYGYANKTSNVGVVNASFTKNTANSQSFDNIAMHNVNKPVIPSRSSKPKTSPITTSTNYSAQWSKPVQRYTSSTSELSSTAGTHTTPQPNTHRGLTITAQATPTHHTPPPVCNINGQQNSQRRLLYPNLNELDPLSPTRAKSNPVLTRNIELVEVGSDTLSPACRALYTEGTLPPPAVDILAQSRSPMTPRLPICRDQFLQMFDKDGRLVDEHTFRELIFKRGLSCDIRKDAWPYLFNIYPSHATPRERELVIPQLTMKYHAMKKRWRELLQKDVTGHQLVEVEYQSDSTLNSVFRVYPSLEQTQIDLMYVGSRVMNETTNHQDASTQHQFLQNQAQIFAGRQPFRMDSLLTSLQVVDKDVPRTDRELNYFSGSNTKNLYILRDILVTYSAFHPDVGYAQGMNDLVSRFLQVLDNEVLAYWCFANYMESIQEHFMDDGILIKLNYVQSLLQELDADLYKHMDTLHVGDMTFCHRWILLAFKREFNSIDSMRCFEAISSHHLELSSSRCTQIMQQHYKRDFQQCQGTNRLSSISMSNDYTFDVFMCATILIDHRNDLLRCEDGADIFQLVCGLSMCMNLKDILCKTEALFNKYCSKSVDDCFQIIDTPPGNVLRNSKNTSRAHIM